MIAERHGRVRAAVGSLSPGYFAVVMASGIVSVGLRLDGWVWLSVALLVISLVCFGGLLLLNVWRLIGFTAQVKADFFDPAQSFGFFTLVAAAGVLGARLSMDYHYGWAVLMLVVSAVGWLLLGYAVPWATVLDRSHHQTVSGANGSWFLWVVASQSVAVLAAVLEPHLDSAHHFLSVLAVVAWSVGVFLYGAEGMFIALREMLYDAQFTPSYWVAMGAAAITVLAGARIIDAGSAPMINIVSELVTGVSIMFWAFATWLYPVLVAAFWWRHRPRHGVPLTYEVTLWSMVFPLGMYAVASVYLGEAKGLVWVEDIGRVELWIAFVAWLLTFAGMLVHLARKLTGPVAGN